MSDGMRDRVNSQLNSRLGDRMNRQIKPRRKYLVTLGAGALASTFGTLAQQPAKAPPKIWRVGFIWATSRAASQARLDTVLRKLREMGYVEGRNFTAEHRFADGNAALSPGFAAELVGRKVDLIVTPALKRHRPPRPPRATFRWCSRWSAIRWRAAW